MPINEVIQNGQKLYIYEKPEYEILHKQYEQLCKLFSYYLDGREDVDPDRIRPDLTQIARVIVRVDERREYFKIFHDGTIIDELKEVALFAFWMIKLQPFHLKERPRNLDDMALSLNEGFAAYLLITTIKSLKKDRFVFSEEFATQLMYGLKNWDLSKESIILMTDAIYEEM